MRFPPRRGGEAATPASMTAARSLRAGVLALVLAAAVVPSVSAQPSLPGTGGVRPGQQMLLQSDSLIYDNDRQLVTADGGVQVFYDGRSITSRRLIYNRQTRRLTAEGAVRMTDAAGNVTTAETLDMTEDARDAFVRGLRLERRVERTRFAAETAERRNGDTTVLTQGVYTACEPCRDNPERPPLWQVRAARIVHNQNEQIIYYEDARLEFFGLPVAYVPFMWSPDGNSPRQSGLLFPEFSRSSRIGQGFGIPYYFALSPFYDLTVTPTYYLRQGLHVSADWRQALPNGWYRVRASGIRQNDPASVGTGFAGGLRPFDDPGARRFRGGIETFGQFQLSDRWRLGWDAALDSDARYFRDYHGVSTSVTERVSTLYLQGAGSRSFFDARLYHFRTYTVGQENIDRQGFMPLVTPVVDYDTAFADPWLGGEFRASANFTRISRNEAMAYRVVNTMPGDPVRYVVPGFAGDYARLSVDVAWRRSFVDPIGQRWTPFFRVRGDVYNVDPNNTLYATTDLNGPTPGLVALRAAPTLIPRLFQDSQEIGFRGMPMAGIDYRYPLVATTGPLVHIVEPVAQVILRPNETRIGALPNEDSQSLVFDDTNLFAVSKFSGFDRLEGGSRANVGLRYTVQAPGGFMASLLFGQSFQLGGLNSFAQGQRDLFGVGLGSGLETPRSDYVARLHVQPWDAFSVTARMRFDERDFRLNRLDLAAQFSFIGLSLGGNYTYIYSDPGFGLPRPIEGVSVHGAVTISPNWQLIAGATYSLQNTAGTPGWVSNSIGLRFNADDCFIFSLDYTNVYAGFGDVQPQRRVMARITLRTLGDIAYGATIGSSGSTASSSLF